MNRFGRAALVALLLVTSTAHADTAGTAFVPEAVFAGRSEGKGELRLLMQKRRPFTVESVGTIQADGRLQLEQTVRFDGKPARIRAWVMWQTSPGHYTATLTGAAGPVVGRTKGNRLTLRYPLTRCGLVMHQTLDLSEDGRTLANRGSIRFLGVPIGRVRETIRLLH